MVDAAETGLKSASDLAYKPGRISQSTAWGILARVYLFRAGEHYREGRNATQAEKKDYFERASFYAQKVMTAGHKLAANYWDPFHRYVFRQSITPLPTKASGKPNLQETTLRIHKPKAVSVTSSDWPVRICPQKRCDRSQRTPDMAMPLSTALRNCTTFM